MAAGILGSPCLLLGNRSVRVRDPQAVAHTSCHTRRQVYRHTHTHQQPSPNTEMCYLTDYSEAPIPPGSSDSPGGKAVRRRIPQSTTQDSRRYAPWELTILTHRNTSPLLFLHTGIRVLCSFIHPATFTKYAWTWPEDVLSE